MVREFDGGCASGVLSRVHTSRCTDVSVMVHLAEMAVGGQIKCRTLQAADTPAISTMRRQWRCQRARASVSSACTAPEPPHHQHHPLARAATALAESAPAVFAGRRVLPGPMDQSASALPSPQTRQRLCKAAMPALQVPSPQSPKDWPPTPMRAWATASFL
jgi:hypothetical protein